MQTSLSAHLSAGLLREEFQDLQILREHQTRVVTGSSNYHKGLKLSGSSRLADCLGRDLPFSPSCVVHRSFDKEPWHCAPRREGAHSPQKKSLACAPLAARMDQSNSIRGDCNLNEELLPTATCHVLY